MSKKRAAWRAHRRKKSADSRVYYNLKAAECRRAVRSFIRESEIRLANSGNLGQFYRYANKKFCCKSSIGVVETNSGDLSSDSHDIVETFQSTFSSYFVSDNSSIPPITAPFTVNSSLASIDFSYDLVRGAINKLNARSAGGPDGIPPVFYKHLKDVLCFPLALLYTACINRSYLPAIWKHAYVTPIFKKGSRTDPNNYRPIALTSTMCKLMESIIKSQMVDFLVTNNLISSHQHAFLSRHSTTTNLLECIHDWVLSLQSHNSTDIIYIDFSRAFDSIVFSKLLYKLKMYSIDGNLLKWIENFITGRFQCVAINNCLSSVCNVMSGVPQGSVLGPILFLVYINDIESVCSDNVTVKLFADDCKLYSEIKLHRPSAVLQECVDRLCLWADQWQLVINVLKCHFLSTRRSNFNSANCVYFINGAPIPNESSVLDLGVNISEDLSPKLHINSIVAKAKQRIGIFFRGFVSRDFNIIRKIFIVYIRPILEFSSVIWNPTEIFLIDLLENVQRSFTKNIPSLSTLSYKERLQKLNLEFLELRRLYFDLIYYHKILNKLTPLDPDKVFMIYHSNPSSRSDSVLLHRPVKATEHILATFFYRNTAAYNSLPIEIKQLGSVSSFKLALRTIDFSKYLKGRVFKF